MEDVKTYSCDFETTTDPADCRVWAWGASNIENTNEKHYGNSLASFFEFIQDCDYKLYFHNLKFDGEFIVSWLLSHGWKWSKDPNPGEFGTVISNTGLWYSVTIVWSKKGKKKTKTTIWDSYKLLPFSVAKLAHDFRLPISKLKLDYKAKREPGHELTEEEKAYLFNDVDIVAMCLAESFREGFNRMTSSSSAFNIFKGEMVGDFKKVYPVLDMETDSEIRPAYYGGFVWTNPAKKQRVIGEGIVFDVNSLYPSRMVAELLPYGKPRRFEGKPQHDELYPLWVCSITFAFDIRPGFIPCITLDKSPFLMGSDKYVYSSDGQYVTLVLSSVDWELITAHYVVDVEQWGGGWKFMACKGTATPYINNCMEVKKKEKGAKRAIAKLKMNSVYGKFATNPDVTPKIPYLDASGVLKLGDPGALKIEYNKEGKAYKVEETGEIAKEYRDPVYIPYGVFITAYARKYTITTAQAVGLDRLCYIDTDSIHLEGTEVPEAIRDLVDDKELGKWGLESVYKRAYFVGSKAYIEEIQITEEEYKERQQEREEEGEELDRLYYERAGVYYRLNVKCAGLTEKAKQNITFNNFRVGAVVPDCLKTTHAPGGIVLIDREFTIKER